LDKRIDGYQSIGWTFAAGIVHFIADAAPLDAKEMGDSSWRGPLVQFLLLARFLTRLVTSAPNRSKASTPVHQLALLAWSTVHGIAKLATAKPLPFESKENF
jgi:hypothetical protein